MSVKPEDILSDDENFTIKNNVVIRKGTVAAFLANAEILMASNCPEDKKAILDTLKELTPGIVALGMHHHVTWNNPLIQALIDEYINNAAT